MIVGGDEVRKILCIDLFDAVLIFRGSRKTNVLNNVKSKYLDASLKKMSVGRKSEKWSDNLGFPLIQGPI